MPLQGILALTVNRLGMSLMRMGKPSESVRFLDDVDLTYTQDSRSTSLHQMQSMEISVQPVVLRASYRDINLITSIANKAIELYSSSLKRIVSEDQMAAVQSLLGEPTEGHLPRSSVSGSHLRPIGNARTLTSKEQVILFLRRRIPTS